MPNHLPCRLVVAIVSSLALFSGTKAAAQPVEIPAMDVIEVQRSVDVTVESEDESDGSVMQNTSERLFIALEEASTQGGLGSSAYAGAAQNTDISTYSVRGKGAVDALAVLGESNGAEVNSQASSFFNVRFHATKSGPLTAFAELEAINSEINQLGSRVSVELIAYPAGSRGWRFWHSETLNSTDEDDTMIFNVVEQVEEGDEIVFSIEAAASRYGLNDDESPFSGDFSGRGLASFDFLLDFGDLDGDGLPDVWEEDGIDFTGAGVEIDLPGMGAKPDKKDIFVELDFMENGLFDAEDLQESIEQVVAAFARAPVDNPDGTEGIKLHVIFGGDTMPQTTMVAEPGKPLSSTFFIAKGIYFGSAAQRSHPDWEDILEARLKIFRYGIVAADFKVPAFGCTNDVLGTSGQAESVPGNDFVVGLGSILAGYNAAPAATQADLVNGLAGTFMHELGHTLGLTHGGGGTDGPQYKPNYLSVMNYAYQMPIPLSDTPATLAFVLDYSRESLLTLDENGLDEFKSLRLTPRPDSELPRYVIYNAAAEDANRAELVLASSEPMGGFDWNTNLLIDPELQTMDITRFVYTAPCTAEVVPPVYETLASFSDWERLHFDLSEVTSATDHQPWPGARAAERGMDEHSFQQLLDADWREHPDNSLIFADGFETGDVDRWNP